MMLRPFILLILSLALAPGVCARFTMPRVDLFQLTPGAKTSMAIHSYSNTIDAAGSTFCVWFNEGMNLPASVGGEWVFMRLTQNKVLSQELSIPAGNIKLPPITGDVKYVLITLPWRMDVGSFYVRFDYDFGIMNPVTPGTMTLGLADYRGVTTVSQPVMVGWPELVMNNKRVVSGFVQQNTVTAQALPGALVIAHVIDSTPIDRWPFPEKWGPSQDGNSPKGVTRNTYAICASSEGRFRFSLPITTYDYAIAAFRNDNTLPANVWPSPITYISGMNVQGPTISITLTAK
jgi:hypothetical protein